jgi:hypothetical protein
VKRIYNISLHAELPRRPEGPFDAMAGFPVWTPAHVSVVREVLTREAYEVMAAHPTRHGFTIDMAIQSAVDAPLINAVRIGCVAGDEESYSAFSLLFDEVIYEVYLTSFRTHECSSILSCSTDSRIPAP